MLITNLERARASRTSVGLERSVCFAHGRWTLGADPWQVQTKLPHAKGYSQEASQQKICFHIENQLAWLPKIPVALVKEMLLFSCGLVYIILGNESCILHFNLLSYYTNDNPF